MAAAERSGSASGGSGAAPLVLYGERSPGDAPRRCPNAVRGLRLAVTDLDGPRYLQLRCQRRDCSYCGWLRDLEDATCLFLDARDHEQPTLAITLTTVTPWEQLDPAAYREASKQLWRALRAVYGRVEYCGLIEFTTGRAARSGGRRRMHGHYLVKGIDPGEVLAVEAIVREVWSRCTGAYVVEVSELRSAGGAIAYMGLHHRKPEQAAPAGWRGMRLRASQGYWGVPVADLRERARRHLAIRARRWRLEQDGASPEWAAIAAELEVDAQREARQEHGVELVAVRERAGGVVVPLGPAEQKPSKLLGQERPQGAVSVALPAVPAAALPPAPGARVRARAPDHGPAPSALQACALAADDSGVAALARARPQRRLRASRPPG